MGFGAIGAATGEGYTAGKAIRAIARNREMPAKLSRTMLVGQAIAESASIFALVMAILLLFMDIPDPGIFKAASLLGAGSVWVSGPSAPASAPGARPDGLSGDRTTTRHHRPYDHQYAHRYGRLPDPGDLCDGGVLDSAVSNPWPGCAAFPTVGRPVRGWGEHRAGRHRFRLRRRFGRRRQLRGSCPSAGNRHGSVTTTMLVGQAVAQTPSVFGLLIGFILMFKHLPGVLDPECLRSLCSAPECAWAWRHRSWRRQRGDRRRGGALGGARNRIMPAK